MERNYAELQEKYETEKIKLLAAEQQASLASKKKIKKKTSPAEPPDFEYRPKSDGVELKSMLKRLHDRINQHSNRPRLVRKFNSVLAEQCYAIDVSP
ncbi:hypothetical protein BDZ94DRAFT_1277286 [Collybia nuda]|nr:hypothetical protein BDZ94DRAFT_1277286 [Collybia nuda]